LPLRDLRYKRYLLTLLHAHVTTMPPQREGS